MVHSDGPIRATSTGPRDPAEGDRGAPSNLYEEPSLQNPVIQEWTTATASTNDRLVEMLEAGADLPDFAVVGTDHQTAGRGRLDRVWTVPPGRALTFSVPVRVPSGTPADALGWLPVVTGVAVRAALAEAGVTAQLKWPNDVLVGGRKLAGLLGEVSGARDCRTLLVGMGVNWMNPVRNSAAIGGYAATSVAEHAPGVTLDDRLSFMREWLAGLAADQQRMMTAPDTTLQAMREEAEALLWRRGQVVEMLHTEQGSVRGRLEGLGVWGTALVREGETVREVSCGWQAFDEGIVGTAG